MNILHKRIYNTIITTALFISLFSIGNAFYGGYATFPYDSYYNLPAEAQCKCNPKDSKPLGQGSVIDLTNGHVTIEETYPIFPTIGEPLQFIRRHLSYAESIKAAGTGSSTATTGNGSGGGTLSTIFTTDELDYPNFGNGSLWSYYEFIREVGVTVGLNAGDTTQIYSLSRVSTFSLYKANHVVLVYKMSDESTYLPQNSIHDRILVDTTTYQRITDDGMRYVYYRRNVVSGSFMGKLWYIQDPHGNNITFTYPATPDGSFLTIADASGNYCRIDWVNNKKKYITNVTFQPVHGAARSFSYTYDAGYDKLTSDMNKMHDDQTGNEIHYIYDDSHRMKAHWTNFDSLSTYYIYDSYGKCTQKSEMDTSTGNTRTWIYSYDSVNYRSTVKDPSGTQTVYQYNGLGTWQITKITVNGTDITQYSHDPHWNRLSVSDGNGNHATNYTYDSYDNVSTITNALSQTVYYYWDTTYSLMTSSMDPIGWVNYFSYNTGTRDLILSVDPMGYTTQRKYNSYGTLSQITNALGQVSYFYYNDSLGLLTTLVSISGLTTQIGYDDYGHKTYTTDPMGHFTYYFWDLDFGLLTTVIDYDGGRTQYYYNSYNALTSVFDAKGNPTFYFYDGFKRLTTEQDAAGHLTLYTYDNLDRLVSKTDPNNNQTLYYYDSLGRVTAKIIGSSTTQYYLDLVSNLTTLNDPNTGIWNWNYDSLNRATQEINPYFSSVGYSFWPTGARQQTYDPDTNTTSFVYDANLRLWKSYHAGFDHWTIFGYDPLGRILERQDQNGVFTDYSYDNESRMTSLWFWQPTDNFNRAEGTNIGSNWQETFGDWSIQNNQLLMYDQSTYQEAVYNPSQTYSNPTMEVSFRILNASSRQAHFIYGSSNYSNYYMVIAQANSNALNRYIAVAHKSSGVITVDAVINYQLVELNQKNRIKIGINGSQVIIWYWESSGWKQIYTYTYGSSIPTGNVGLGTGFGYVYFDDFVLNNNRTTLQRMNYSYNSDGNRTQASDKDSNTVTYTYDPLHRLTSEGGNTYNYDSVGNRLQNGYFSYNSLNQLTLSSSENDQKEYSYDDNGNLGLRYDPLPHNLFSYYWDENNLLTQYQYSVGEVDYVNNALGKRVLRGESGVTTQYFYDGNNVLMERQQDNGASNYTTRMVYNLIPSMIGQIISVRQTSDTITTYLWYHYDPIGNVLFITDTSGNIVSSYNQDGFGNGSFNSGYHLTTKELDSTSNLYYFGARWYDPVVGRFISKEPLGLDGPNYYQYTFNNPVNNFDPNGLKAPQYHFVYAFIGELATGHIKKSWNLAWESLAQDFIPNAWDDDAMFTDRHGLPGLLPDGTLQTPEQAKQATENFIICSFKNGNIGGALHAIGDKDAFSHQNYPILSNTPWYSPTFIMHTIGDWKDNPIEDIITTLDTIHYINKYQKD